MIRYSMSQDMIFVILALISALAMLSEHPAVSFIFFILAILFVSLEDRLYKYVKSA